MNLKTFEKLIEPKILDRGFSYYEGDSLEDIEKVDKNEFCCVAIGTEKYNVFIKFDASKNIVEHSCDCPYDWGNYCKHEAALLYYLKDAGLNSFQLGEGKINTIKNDLQKLNKSELIQMVVDLSKRNKAVKNEVYWELGYEEEY